jgi:hypothetical protein
MKYKTRNKTEDELVYELTRLGVNIDPNKIDKQQLKVNGVWRFVTDIERYDYLEEMIERIKKLDEPKYCK